MKCDHSVQYVVVTHLCASVHVFWVGGLFTPLSIGHLEVNLPATETGPKLRENFTNCQAVKNTKKFQLLVVQLFRSQFVDEDEGDRSPCDS